jgi:hypothetical protein
VHPPGARVIPRHDELLGVLTYKRRLVVCLFEGAREGGVPILDVESARETNVTIAEPLVNI